MSSMLVDEEDAAFQADLARAIAASLELDALGPYESNIRNPESHSWNALLAAGEAATTWGGLGRGSGGGFGTGGIPSSLAPTSGGGRSSPNLLASDLEDDEDEEYQRQLAAAMEASLQSAHDERQRRAQSSSGRLENVAEYDDVYEGVSLGRGWGGGGGRSEGGGESFSGAGAGSGAPRFDVNLMTRHVQQPQYQVPHPPSPSTPPHRHHHNYLPQQPPVWQQCPQAQLQQHHQAAPSSVTTATAGGGGAVCCSSGLVLKPLVASRVARSGSSAALHPLGTSTTPTALPPSRTVTTAMVIPSQGDIDISPRSAFPAATVPRTTQPPPVRAAIANAPPTPVEPYPITAGGARTVMSQVWREAVAAADGGLAQVQDTHMEGPPPARAQSLSTERTTITRAPLTANTDSSRASSDGQMSQPLTLLCEARGASERVLSSSPVKHARPASLGGAGESVQPLTKRSRPESSNSNDSGAACGGSGLGGPPGGLIGTAAVAMGGIREPPSGGGGGGGGGRMGSPEDSGLLPLSGVRPGGGRGGLNDGKGGVEVGMEQFWEDGAAELPAVSHSPPERPASASSCCTTAVHQDVDPQAGGEVVLGGTATTNMMGAGADNGYGARSAGGVNGSGVFTLDLSAVAAAATTGAATTKTLALDSVSQWTAAPAGGVNVHPYNPAMATHALVSGLGNHNARSPSWELHGAPNVGSHDASVPDDLPTWQQDAGRMLRRVSADDECRGEDVTLLSCRETISPPSCERSRLEARRGQQLSLSKKADGRGSLVGGGGGMSGGGAPPNKISWQDTPFVMAATEVTPLGAPFPQALPASAPPASKGAGGINSSPMNVSPKQRSNIRHLPKHPTEGADPVAKLKASEALPDHASRQVVAFNNTSTSTLPLAQQKQHREQQRHDDPHWSHTLVSPRWRYSGADRRMLRYQQVWWWCGPGQVQLGRITSIDYRSEPPLYTVRLDPDQIGKEGELVMATADCLLPYVSHGDWVMCRLSPPPLAWSFVRRVTVEEDGGRRRSSGSEVMEEAGGHGVVVGLGNGARAEGWTRHPASVDIAPSCVSVEEDDYNQAACVWMAGRMQHCIFDGPVPRVAVLLGGSEALPYELPYEHVVPVSDAAESSGGAGSSSGSGGGGLGSGRHGAEVQGGGGVSGSGGNNGAGHTAVNTCLEIVLA